MATQRRENANEGDELRLIEAARRQVEHAPGPAHSTAHASGSGSSGFGLGVGTGGQAAADPADSPREAAEGVGPTQREGDGVPPAFIPGYTIQRELHRGGQGIVYLATQEATHRPVAIKVVREGPFAGPADRARFEREVEILASLRHPGIVSIHDSGSAFGCFYYVMSYVDGVRLDAWVRQQHERARGGGPADQRLRLRETLGLFVRICEAMNAAHVRGVIHRDLKPGNVLVDRDGHPHVLDFGLAKRSGAGEPGSSDLTATGQFLGTLPWASPEQAEGAADKVDIRTDVYAIGLLLHHAVTGRMPRSPALAGTMRGGRIETTAAAPEEVGRAGGASRRDQSRRSVVFANRDIETIIRKCLSVERERRYQSAGEVARDLQRHLAGDPIEARRDSRWYLLATVLRRYRLVAATIAAAVVLLAVFGAVMTVLYQRAVAAERLAAQRWHLAQQERIDADHARRAAELDRAEAGRQAAISREALRFMNQDLLGSANPTMTLGADPPVSRVLETAAARVDGAFTDEPLVQATVRSTIGQAYRRLGRCAESEPQLRAALEVFSRELGERHPDTLMAMVELARALVESGDFDEPDALLLVAAAVAEEDFGPAGDITLSVRAAQVRLRLQQGAYREAEALARDIINVGRSNPSWERRFEPMIAPDLAHALVAQGRTTEAEPVLRAAHDAAQAAFGVEHTQTVLAQNNLAHALMELGRLREAEELFRLAVETMKRVLGPEHPHTLGAMSNLATVLQRRAAFEQAEPLAREVGEISARTLGPKHPQTLTLRNNVGTILEGQRRHIESEAVFRAVYEDRCAAIGAEHPDTLMTLNNLATALIGQNRQAEAAPLLHQVLEARERLLGTDHQHTLMTVYALASVLRTEKRYAEAEPLFRRAVETSARVLPDGHWQTAAMRAGLGACLTSLGEFEGSERQLLEAYEVLNAKVGPRHAHTRNALRLLVELYEKWDRAEVAERYRVLYRALPRLSEAEDK